MRVIRRTTHSSIPVLPVIMAASARAIAAAHSDAWLRVLPGATSARTRFVTVMEESVG